MSVKNQRQSAAAQRDMKVSEDSPQAAAAARTRLQKPESWLQSPDEPTESSSAASCTDD